MKKPIAVVLGGTTPHIALINNLKGRGYHTVLVDYYENPPAKSAADEHIRESTLDQEKVLAIAQERRADLVIATCIDQANVTACYVAEQLMLPKPYSYETALKVTNKGIMKKMMLERGIPTSDYILVNQIDDPRISSLRFPLVVKPSDCTGSKGVRKATTNEELCEYLTGALQVSRSNAAIVEEFKEGMEVQADFFVKDAEAILIMIRKKAKTVGLKGSILQSMGSIIPVDVSEQAMLSLLEIANRIVRVFKLENTSLFFQAIVSGDDVTVVEFAARVGGGLSNRMIQLIAGFDIVDATVNTFLGLPVKVIYKHPESHYSTVILYTRPCIYSSVVGYQELLDRKCIEEFFFFKTKGMKVGEELTSSNRVGAFLVQSDIKQELFDKIKMAIEKLEILDDKGNPVMRRDLYDGFSL